MEYEKAVMEYLKTSTYSLEKALLHKDGLKVEELYHLDSLKLKKSKKHFYPASFTELMNLQISNLLENLDHYLTQDEKNEFEQLQKCMPEPHTFTPTPDFEYVYQNAQVDSTT